MTTTVEHKRYALLRGTGRSVMVKRSDDLFQRALANVHSLYREHGMTWDEIANGSGCISRQGVSQFAAGETDSMRRVMAATLAAMRPSKPLARPGGYVPAIGTTRRLQGLHADGFNINVISSLLGWERGNAYRLMTRAPDTYVAYRTLDLVDGMYRRVELCQASEFVSRPHLIRDTRRAAMRNGYAPRGCWDSDTIDDPSAYPEWTGKCGTRRGRKLHYEHKMPVRINLAPKGTRVAQWVVLCHPCLSMDTSS